MTTVDRAVVTPEALLAMSDSVNFELVDGNLVERHMGTESSAIALAVGSVLRQYVVANRLGHAFTTDCGYQCFPDDPTKVRKPDVSFIRTGRLPGERLPTGYTRIPPDLAVEVLSPGDLAYEVDEKIEEYLSAGVQLIWIVSPLTKTIRIHRPATSPLGPIGTVKLGQSISGEEILPGFSCLIDEFFNV
ncbi:MAG TPA: Uma2 family endonuclease [Tepidisphaeraceae bacterium]|jgi:Uma2 family endonuclease